jgi:hypothetical protein
MLANYNIRVSDYIVNTLASQGIDHVFMVTGGASMLFSDAYGCETRIKKVFCHHEQSCAIAPESCANLRGKFKRNYLKRGANGAQGCLALPLLHLCTDLATCLCGRLHGLELGRRFNASSPKEEGKNGDLASQAEETSLGSGVDNYTLAEASNPPNLHASLAEQKNRKLSLYT